MSGTILRRRDRTVRSLRVEHYSSAVNNRLVHHAVIFEMNVESYRRRAALERATSKRDTASDIPNAQPKKDT